MPPDVTAAVTAFANHVLGQHAWARARLCACAGRTVKVCVLPFVFDWVITPEGLVGAIVGEPSAKSVSHVTLSIPLALLPQFAFDADAAMKSVRIEGDAELAQVLGQLAREVRWDAEDDLARLTGGAAAHSLMQGAKSLRAYAKDASQRWQETVSAFLLDEDPTLVRRSAGEQFARDVSTLRDDTARLEKRLEQLEARARGNAGSRA